MQYSERQIADNGSFIVATIGEMKDAATGEKWAGGDAQVERMR